MDFILRGIADGVFDKWAEMIQPKLLAHLQTKTYGDTYRVRDVGVFATTISAEEYRRRLNSEFRVKESKEATHVESHPIKTSIHVVVGWSEPKPQGDLAKTLTRQADEDAGVWLKHHLEEILIAHTHKPVSELMNSHEGFGNEDLDHSWVQEALVYRDKARRLRKRQKWWFMGGLVMGTALVAGIGFLAKRSAKAAPYILR